MQYLNPKQTLINIIFDYKTIRSEPKQYPINEIIENVLKSYALEVKIDLNSIVFLYNGKKIERQEYKKTLNDIIHIFDREINKMYILVLEPDREENEISQQNNNGNENNNKINLKFILNSENTYQIEVSSENKLKEICIEYTQKNNLIFNSLSFQYGGKKIDLNKKFSEIISDFDKRCRGMHILVYSGNPLKIEFSYKRRKLALDCLKEDKIIDVFNIYSKMISKKTKDLNFYYGNNINPIQLNSDYTFNQLINNNESNSLDTLNTNYAFNNNINKILISVNDIPTNNYTPTPTYIYVNEPFCNEEKKNYSKK